MAARILSGCPGVLRLFQNEEPRLTTFATFGTAGVAAGRPHPRRIARTGLRPFRQRPRIALNITDVM